MKKALIFQGGWDGHEPKLVSQIFAGLLAEHNVQAEIISDMAPMCDAEWLRSFSLIVPCWTMGEIPADIRKNIAEAVASGVGLAGCHGGMCDAFRQDTEWQFMTGGQWVAHPGGDGVAYTVNIRPGSSPIVQGLHDFSVASEQYYLHVDPAVEVLATTRFPVVDGPYTANKPVDMPVVWTKFWGEGRVFYCSLGHHADIFTKYPTASALMQRGMLWAAGESI